MAPPTPYVITYFTNDIEANRRFYGDVLGLALHSELPEVYFLCGSGGWRLQILQLDPERPGRDRASAGLVLFGVESDEELAAFEARLEATGQVEADGYRDPDGRIVMAQVYNASLPFHN